MRSIERTFAWWVGLARRGPCDYSTRGEHVSSPSTISGREHGLSVSTPPCLRPPPRSNMTMAADTSPTHQTKPLPYERSASATLHRVAAPSSLRSTVLRPWIPPYQVWCRPHLMKTMWERALRGTQARWWSRSLQGQRISYARRQRRGLRRCAGYMVWKWFQEARSPMD